MALVIDIWVASSFPLLQQQKAMKSILCNADLKLGVLPYSVEALIGFAK